DVVVKVLEAVHLLLAFRSFVVVVGVDVRWLENSLLKHYKGQLDGGATKTDSSLVFNPASPRDYLEKIFQIPFWLRPLTFSGEKGGTYEAFTAALGGTTAPRGAAPAVGGAQAPPPVPPQPANVPSSAGSGGTPLPLAETAGAPPGERSLPPPPRG